MGMGMPCCPGPMGRTMNIGCPPGAIICRPGGWVDRLDVSAAAGTLTH